MGRLFGTDGIRGTVGVDLTMELALDVGRAAVAVLGRLGEGKPSFVVGRDTRASGELLEDALVEGIRLAGGHVHLVGVVPTPTVAFLTTELGASSGVVISASHNPAEDNGIKFFGSDGRKLPDRLEEEIEELLGAPTADALERGEILAVPDCEERYLRHLEAAAEGPLTGMTVVVDCANGAAWHLAPEALRRLGARVHPIFDRPNGININDRCGAGHPQVVASEVLRVGADAGVAHDGDADRALFADAAGRVIDGDQVLAACALAMKFDGRLKSDLLVATIMANLGFRRAMEEAGIETVFTGVGDRYVIEEMRRSGAALGGEQSGHIIFAEYSTTGDGILTAIVFLSLAARQGVSLGDLANRMLRYPQVLENVPVADREGLEGAAAVWETVRAAEGALGSRGRVLVRASGTEPLVRVMVEAETDEEASRHAKAIADIVRATLA